MEPITAFLLSMQAAGLVTSVLSTRSQDKVIKLGRKLEQSQFEYNIEAVRTQSEESSLAEMKALRKNIGSQIAINAARGNRGGSSVAGINESVKNVENDERRRRMNLLAKEAEMRSGNILSGLHTAQSETQLGQSLLSKIFDTIPVSSFAGKVGRSSNPSSSAADTGFSWGIR